MTGRRHADAGTGVRRCSAGKERSRATAPAAPPRQTPDTEVLQLSAPLFDALYAVG
jgi:hypothetical protein